MTRRPASWQAEKARTAKALRELPLCATPNCDGRAMGILFGCSDDVAGLCPGCARELIEQRAQRERRT